MILLTTGTPGSGKTAYTLSLMLRELGIQTSGDALRQRWSKVFGKAREEAVPRPLYQHGIPDLAIDNEAILCRSAACTLCRDLEREWDGVTGDPLYIDQWHVWAPSGALIVLDEVQHCYRPRGVGSKVPDDVAAFETHRHRGIDFYLISQNPKLIDSNLRRLINVHRHIRGNFAGRKLYEWSECQENVQSLAGAVSSTYTLPKHVFPLYRSAEIHTKLRRKIPLAVWIFLFTVPLGAFLFFRIQAAIAEQTGADSSASVRQAEIGPTQRSTEDAPAARAISESGRSQPFNFTPAVAGVLESAPAFSGLVQVRDYPQMRACVATETRCTCYTQQGTVYPTDVLTCRDTINGRRFNPYVAPSAARAVSTAIAPPTGLSSERRAPGAAPLD